jgi:hypothetical protein
VRDLTEGKRLIPNPRKEKYDNDENQQGAEATIGTKKQEKFGKNSTANRTADKDEKIDNSDVENKSANETMQSRIYDPNARNSAQMTPCHPRNKRNQK